MTTEIPTETPAEIATVTLTPTDDKSNADADRNLRSHNIV